jgi:hypothetical protein
MGHIADMDYGEASRMDYREGAKGAKQTLENSGGGGPVRPPYMLRVLRAFAVYLLGLSQWRRRIGWALGLTAVLALTAGCCPQERPAYWGPTLPLREVVETINANNARIPSVWSYVKSFNIEWADDRGDSHSIGGNDGNLVFLRPRDLYLECNLPGVEAFEIGTTQQCYWLMVPKADKMWKGTYANIDRVDLRQLPIAPEMLLDVLGISTVDDNLLQWPLPVMRFDNYRDAYVMLWSFPLVDHWVAQKEVWYDRKSLLPQEIRLYDAEGRMVVRALLSEMQALLDNQDDNAAATDAPRMATNYDLLFPVTKTHLHLSLDHPSLRNGKVPNAKTFPTLEGHLANPEVKEVYDLDRTATTQP